MESVNRMLHTTLLAAHIFAGSAGLVLGPVAMYLDTRRFSAGQRGTGRASGVHRGAVLLVCLSAVGLVIENRPELWVADPGVGADLWAGRARAGIRHTAAFPRLEPRLRPRPGRSLR